MKPDLSYYLGPSAERATQAQCDELERNFMEAKLSTLLAKLEQARAGSRELELEIALAIDHRASGGKPRWESIRAGVKQEGREQFLSDSLGYVHQIPAWTRSLDAALLLVPAGCGWSIDDTGYAIVTRSGLGFLSEHGDDEFHGKGATPALALVIASLKARTPEDRP